jgi:hypothetical protein
MAVNGYFNNYPDQNRFNNEHMLMEDVIVESIQIMGHNVYYIPREALDNVDMIFGESTKVKFKHAYLIEAYLVNVEGFEGDKDFFSKFGLEIRDSSNFVLSRRSFARIVPSSLRERPQEGDLVYVPLMHRMFEIKFIDKTLMFFSLGKRLPYVYEMRCEQFRYSEEEIDTGIEAIDSVEEENAYTIKITLNTSGTGTFIDGETVYQSTDGTWANNTSSGKIKEWYAANGMMLLYDVEGSFTANSNVYSNTTNAIYKTIISSEGIDTLSDYNEYDLSNNKDFYEGATLILDLSELNPFGTP